MKEAVSKIAGIQLIYQEELSYIKIIHRKGDKRTFWFGTYKSDLFEYKGTIKFNSLDELSTFIGKNIYIDENNKIWTLPQIRIHQQISFMSGKMECISFKSNEDAEQKFKEMLDKYNLIMKKI